jgi:hypothetical protein
LRWEPRVLNAVSRLPGGSGRIVGGLDRDEAIEDLRYDIEIYRKNPGSAAHKRAKNDYTSLWRAFWGSPSAYDDGESDVERERAYQQVHVRQGIRETQYVIPFDLEPGAIYAWRVRPVYRYKGQTVAEDWMRENIVVHFGFVSYSNTIKEFITTSPPEFVFPSKYVAPERGGS